MGSVGEEEQMKKKTSNSDKSRGGVQRRAPNVEALLLNQLDVGRWVLGVGRLL